MSTALHQRSDVCELSDQSLETVLQNHANDNTVVIAVEDTRLTPYLPVHGQQTLGTHSHIPFPDETEYCIHPLYNPHNTQETYLPHKNNEQYHYDTNAFDTVIQLFSVTGYFQRAPPFLDATRITKPGGRIVTVTGVQPTEPSDHDAKYWVPTSNYADLDTIRVLRHEDFQTPILVSEFTVTATPPIADEPVVTTQ